MPDAGESGTSCNKSHLDDCNVSMAKRAAEQRNVREYFKKEKKLQVSYKSRLRNLNHYFLLII